MRSAFIMAVVCSTALAACQSVPPPATASGRPEVTIPRAQPAKVKALLVSKMLDKGYRLIKDDSFNVTFEKPSENFVANVLLETPFGGIPVARVNFTIAEIGPEVRIVADLALIQNAGTAFERRNDVSRGASSPEIQKFLDDVAAAVEPAKVARR